MENTSFFHYDVVRRRILERSEKVMKKKMRARFLTLVIVSLAVIFGGVNIYNNKRKNAIMPSYQVALKSISSEYDSILQGNNFHQTKYFSDEAYISMAARADDVLDGTYRQLYASYHDLNNDGVKECIISVKLDHQVMPIGILTYANHKVKVVRLIDRLGFNGDHYLTIHNNQIYEFYITEGAASYDVGKMSKEDTFKIIQKTKNLDPKDAQSFYKDHATDISLTDHKIPSSFKDWMIAYSNMISSCKIENAYFKDVPQMLKYAMHDKQPLKYALVALEDKIPTLIVTNANGSHVTPENSYFAIYQYTSEGLNKMSAFATSIHYNTSYTAFVLTKETKSSGVDTFYSISKKGFKKLYKVTYDLKDHKRIHYKLDGKSVSTKEITALWKKNLGVTYKNGKVKNADTSTLTMFDCPVEANKHIFRLKK